MAEQHIGTPKNVTTDEERPAIHIALATGLADNAFNWVAIGAEEEGVPCRRVAAQGSNPVAMAYDAAMSSRFGVGVGIAGSTVVVHELHMPSEQPVLTFEGRDDLWRYCRLAGGNAARLIIRMPFRFELEPDPPTEHRLKPAAHRESHNTLSPTPPRPDVAGVDPELVRAITKIVARIIYERGML
ncbi:MAG: glycerol dehydratase reactivase beta/small subunit family protein [Anaerolineae bacterium]|nr:glycerol dehydratase reactivase beta/small subunit family protein [Anaerolineae bacterium]